MMIPAAIDSNVCPTCGKDVCEYFISKPCSNAQIAQVEFKARPISHDFWNTRFEATPEDYFKWIQLRADYLGIVKDDHNA